MDKKKFTTKEKFALACQRRQRLLEELKLNSPQTIAQLINKFRTAPSTMRNDLYSLRQQKKIDVSDSYPNYWYYIEEKV